MTAPRRARLMGGVVEIVTVGGPPSAPDRALDLLAELHRRWSRFDEESDLSRLNAARGEATRVHPETARLVGRLAELRAETGGAFDPTRLPDLLAAGYSASRDDGRAAPDLDPAARAGGDLAAVHVAGDSVVLPAGLTLDLGGIAKGHAASLAVAELRALGCRGALVSVAGDLAVSGESPSGRSWRVGVEDPGNPERHAAVLEIDEGAVATSSRLKRSWTGPDGSTRHHLIDPRSGLPAVGPVDQMTVAAPDGARAEAWAKTGFVHRDALERADAAGLAALTISRAGEVRATTTGRWQQ